jgi:glutamate 5-kinase
MKIVIKVGTSSISGNDPMGINSNLVEQIVDVIGELKTLGHEVVLVSSGAVGLGCKQLGFTEKPKSIVTKQAAASVGQNLLTNVYQEFFKKYNQVIGQVLLTKRGMQDKELYLNARLTLRELLKLKVVPIINENDAVADEEIKFGDNDSLSALVSELITAEHLFILTDIEGLFTEDPRVNPNAKLIELVEEVDFEIESKASSSGSAWGTGGMASKIQAAKLATSFGTTVHIMSGQKPRQIIDILHGQSCGTTFLPRSNPVDAKKAWIAFGAPPKGKFFIDDGALQAIKKGKSLLPVGIKKVFGKFGRGEAIQLIYTSEDEKKQHLVAVGITKYSIDDTKKIKGHLSEEIEAILGYSYGNSVIHRDDLVVLTPEEN